jgi:recombinational DNA repair protein (RecF pathway)
MTNTSHSSHHGSACCAICGAKFGLIRYYRWRTALCSKKCVDRFKARREADDQWLRWLQAV